MGTIDKQTQRELMTVPEAARKLGVTPQSVYRWIDDGTLAEVPVSGLARIVDAQSVRELAERRAIAAAERIAEDRTEATDPAEVLS